MTFQMTNKERGEAEDFLRDIIRTIKMRVAFHDEQAGQSDDVEAQGYNELVGDEARRNLRIAINILNEIKIASFIRAENAKTDEIIESSPHHTRANPHDIRNENQLDLINEMNDIGLDAISENFEDEVPFP